MINQTLCRLKDIVALFMDTGIGRDGYSIIGQGRVNDVLSNRSEDRRRIFDEAAGIVKFKTRRLDAVRKLEATDQNLVRINDTIHELEDRVGPLADQAKMAQEWQILAEQHKTLDLAMALYQLDDQEKQLAQARAAMDALLADLEQEKAQQESIRRNINSTTRITELDLASERKRQEHSH